MDVNDNILSLIGQTPDALMKSVASNVRRRRLQRLPHHEKQRISRIVGEVTAEHRKFIS